MLCFQLGYPSGAAAFTQQGLFGSKIQADFVITDLKCTGLELRIQDCQMKTVKLRKERNLNQKPSFLAQHFRPREEQTLEKAKAKVYNKAGVICQVGPIKATKGLLLHGTSSFSGNAFMINSQGFLGSLKNICGIFVKNMAIFVICQQITPVISGSRPSL